MRRFIITGAPGAGKTAISLEDGVRFEKVHEDTYRDLGFELIDIDPGTVAGRVRAITTLIAT